MINVIPALAWAASSLLAPQLYGDLREGEKLLQDVPMTLTCGADTAKATTDNTGSFVLAVKNPGTCVLTVTYGGQKPTLTVVVYSRPVLCRLKLEQKSGKYALTRQ